MHEMVSIVEASSTPPMTRDELPRMFPLPSRHIAVVVPPLHLLMPASTWILTKFGGGALGRFDNLHSWVDSGRNCRSWHLDVYNVQLLYESSYKGMCGVRALEDSFMQCLSLS